MENKNTISKTGTGTGTGEEESTGEVKNNENEKMQRIAVSKEAQNTLKAITDKVNDGFMGGKVNLLEMANWILLRFQNELDETKIKEIRAEHFDEVAMLESVLKQAKESGKVPSDFKVLLQKQLGLEEPAKRKPKGP